MGSFKKALKWVFVIYIVGWLLQVIGLFVFSCSGNASSGYFCDKGGELGRFLVNIDVLYFVATPILFIVFVVWALILVLIHGILSFKSQKPRHTQNTDSNRDYLN